jgi:membrane protease YdiL (CAAX protease family)
MADEGATMALLGIPPAISLAIYALVVALAFPFADLASIRRLKRHTSSAARLALYRSGVVFLWTAAALAVALTHPQSLFTVPRSPADFGWLYANPWAFGMASLLVGALLILIFSTGLQCMLKKGVREKIAPAMNGLRFLLPVSRTERFWWALMSVSAGICEEVLYRGFLLEFLRGRLEGGPQLGLTSALLLSTIAFSAGHLYQGAAGMIKTAVLGLLFGMLAILSGSLLLPIVCHVLIDLQILWMYRPAVDAPDDARLLINGCEAKPG